MHRWRSPGANLGPGWLMVLVAPADSWLWSSAGPVCLFHLVEVDEHRSIQGDPRLEILDQFAPLAPGHAGAGGGETAPRFRLCGTGLPGCPPAPKGAK